MSNPGSLGEWFSEDEVDVNCLKGSTTPKLCTWDLGSKKNGSTGLEQVYGELYRVPRP